MLRGTGAERATLEEHRERNIELSSEEHRAFFGKTNGRFLPEQSRGLLRRGRDMTRYIRIGGALVAAFALNGCRQSAASNPAAEPKAVELLNAMEKRIAMTPAYEASGKVERLMPDGRLEAVHWDRVRFVRPQATLIFGDSSQALLGDGKMSKSTSSIQSFDGRVNISKWSGEDEIRQLPQDGPPHLPFKVLSPSYRLGAKWFWPGEWSAARVNDLTLRSLRYLGKQEWNGATYDVVKWVTQGGYFAPEGDFTDTTYIYLAPDHTPRRMRIATSKGRVTDEQIFQLTLDAPLQPSDAAFPLPPAAKIDSNYDAMYYNPANKPYLEYAGKTAPDFTIPTAQGADFKLSDQRSKKRYTMFYIWFYG
jgi:hypothetical protein